MRLLCIGDAVSREGSDILERRLPALKREHRVDFTIVNGENSALGNGIDSDAYKRLPAAGSETTRFKKNRRPRCMKARLGCCGRTTLRGLRAQELSTLTAAVM